MAVMEHSPVLAADLAELVIQCAPALVVVYDRDGRLLLFNPYCEAVTGYLSEEVLGKVVWEFLVPPEQAERVRTTILAHAESRNFHPVGDYHFLTRDGRRRLIHWQMRALFDPAGETTRVLGIGLDITEHRAAEQAIHDSEQRLQRLTGFLQALRQVEHVTTQQKHRHSLLQSICDILISTRDYYSACLLLFDERRSLVDSAEAGSEGDSPPVAQALFAGALRPWMQEALKHQDAQPVTDPLAVAALVGAERGAERGAENPAALVAALRHGHRTFGVLSVAYPEDAAETAEEQAFVAEVASALALALYAREQEEAHERTQAAAREALEEFRAMVETTASWIANCDLDLRVRFWNQAAEEISGYSMLEVLNHAKIYSWLFPEAAEREHFMQAINRVLRGGERIRNFETVITCKDGQRRTVSWAGSPLRGGSGEIIGGVLIGHDITDYKRAEQALRERNREFTALFNSAADEILVIDLRGPILEANRAACEMLGYSRAELRHMGMEGLHTPEEAAEVTEHWDEILRAGQARFETTHRRRDGSCLPLEINVQLIDFQGKPAALNIGRDLSGRRWARETIRLQQNLTQRFVEVVDAVVVSVGADGKILALSRQAGKLLGADAEEVRGQDWFDLAVPEADREHRRVGLAAMLAQEEGVATEYQKSLVSASGRKVMLHWHVLVMHDAAGNAVGTLSTGVVME